MTQDRSRLIFQVVVSVLFLGVVFTAIFGWFVMQNVRETAQRTDLDMRCVAWAALSFACVNDGRFPTSADELFQMEVLPESISCTPDGTDSNWPTTRAEAMRGLEPPSLADAFRRMDVAFSSDGTLPPRIDPRGLPTLVDPPTKPTIREWLFSFPVNDA